jgi:hypothetical protein
VGDCTTCTTGACADGQVSMCELVGYACAWMRGCNDDLAGMTLLLGRRRAELGPDLLRRRRFGVLWRRRCRTKRAWCK